MVIIKKFSKMSILENNNFNKIYFTLLFFVSLFFIFITFNSGFIMGGDSYTYVEWVDFIKIGSYEFINDNDSHSQKGYNYLITVFIIYFCQLLSIKFWQYIFIYLNLCIFIYLFILIFFLFDDEIKSLPVLLFSFYIFFLNFEQFLWVRYILTDYFFYLLVSLSLYAFIKMKNFSLNRYTLLLILIFILSFFTRPTYIIFGLIFSLKILKFFCNLFRINHLYPIFCFFSLMIFGIFFTYVIQSEIINDLSLERIAQYYSQGSVVLHRYHTYLEINEVNIIILIKLFCYKFIYFFVFWDQIYSFKHNLINSIIFIPTYVFAIFSLYKYKKFSDYHKKIIFNCIIYILSFAFFHALISIDYDWRFRLPVYFPIFLISILGFYKLKR